MMETRINQIPWYGKRRWLMNRVLGDSLTAAPC